MPRIENIDIVAISSWSSLLWNWAGPHSFETVSVTGFKTCSLLLGILRLEDAAEYPTQEYVLPDLTDFLETEDKSDYPRKATGDDEDLEVVVTQISPGVKSWPYPDNQEGLESSTSPCYDRVGFCEQICVFMCVCVCFICQAYWFIV